MKERKGIKLSLSKIFLLALICFIFGISLAPLLPAKPIIYLALAIPPFSCFLASCVHKKMLILAAAFLFFSSFFLGLWRADQTQAFYQQQFNLLKDSSELTAAGVVCSAPEKPDKFLEFNLCLDHYFAADWQKSDGKIAVSAADFEDYEMGDRLEVNGKYQATQKINNAKRIIGYLNYAETKKVGHEASFYSALSKIKKYFEATARKIIPEPMATFLLGLLLGIKAGLPKDLIDAFARTGTSHIIAISGFNITIIADILRRYLAGLGPKISFIIIVSILIIFTLITGAESSVVRAAIMGLLLVIGRFFGRARNMTVAITFAAAAMIFLNPLILNYDLGFQLSFASTLGLIYLAPIFDRKIIRLPKIFREPLSATLSAQIFSLPLIVVAFQSLSMVAPATNVLILPLIPLTMGLGFLTIMVGMVWPYLAILVGWVTYLALAYIIWVVEYFSRLHFASLKIENLNASYFMIYYTFLIIFLFEFYQRKKKTLAD